MTSTTNPNPVIRRTALRAYPGWTVREYADGMFDAAHAVVGIAQGCDSFTDAVEAVREIEDMA
jgi:hypothetical protein